MPKSAELKSIAFVVPTLDAGGAERVVAILASSLIDHFKVHIITIADGKVFYHIPQGVQLTDISNKTSSKHSFLKSIKNNIRLRNKLMNYCKLNDISLLIGFTTTANILSCMIAKTLNLKAILCERANPLVYRPNKFWSLLRTYYYKYANTLVVQTEFSKSFFTNFVKPDRIVVMPNPLSLDIMTGKDEHAEKKNIIINVGRFDENKNQQMTIKAFSQIKDKNWILQLIGNGPLLEDCKKLAKQLGIQERVSFPGKVKNISDYYNSSKIFAFSSKSEGFPNALLEAMYFNLASVAVNCNSGPSDLIIHGENGFLVDQDDEQAFIGYLDKLTQNAELVSSMGEIAFNSTRPYWHEFATNQWVNLITSKIRS